MSPSLPDHTLQDGKKLFDISNSAMDQIIFNVEGDIKDIITYLAKEPTNSYGNTTTAVLHQWIMEMLETKHNIIFTTKTKTLSSNVKEMTELEKLNALKKHTRELKKLADFSYYQAELQAGKISMESINTRMMEANAGLMKLVAEGYDINELSTTKKTFGSKWQESSWIYEVSRKLDIDEEVTMNNKLVTRKKADPNDRHYLQYNDNGITLICPHIFENALYLKYSETDEYFNRELRKVSAQNLKYDRSSGDEREEWLEIIDEFCPQEKVSEAKKYITDKSIELIGIHLVKLERKGMRKYRYICIDMWDSKYDNYKQIVFMVDRGYGTEDTSQDFYQLFQWVVGKKDKPKQLKVSGANRVGFSSDASKNGEPIGIALKN